MATQVAIRWRRSAAERHALACVEREIRANDPHSRRKYLREFSEAFRDYEAVLTPAQAESALLAADLLLVGDYHALPASQRYAAELLGELAGDGRPVVLGLEMAFARDQHILDAWMRGEIEEAELRERIRFDLDWGYDWQPYRDLLQAARQHAAAIYGLDCMPRDDMRRIPARDRHAAAKLAEVRQAHPRARIMALFGESHLAPTHLPLQLHARLAHDRILTVLQNVDPLYWRAAGERRDRVQAVRVSSDALCVFNATPLEKYESYRICIERWRQLRPAAPDVAPTLYNLVDALARFLNVDRYSAHNSTQPRFLVDLLPEVHSRSSLEPVRKLLARNHAAEQEVTAVLRRLEERGSCYLPRLNAILVTNFQMLRGAEDAAQFLHRACRGALAAAPRCSEASPGLTADPPSPEDAFYTRTLEEALAYFGSRVLYPARASMREQDLYALYAQPREVVEEQSIYSYREYMQMLDALVLHKDYEANPRAWWEAPDLMRAAVQSTGPRFDFLSHMLGQMLGAEIYDAWISGRVAKRWLRSLFFRRLDAPGAARQQYFAAVRRIRKPRRRMLAA